MTEFRISRSQLQQYTQGLGPQASEGDRGSHQAEAKSRLHEMARDLVSSSGQIKSGYLRLQSHGQDQVSISTNRWQRSGQTDAATDLVRQLVRDAYGQNDQVDAALNAYLGSAKNNKLGTRSFVKLVTELDRATTGQVQDARLADARHSRAGSLKTDLFAASFRLQQQGGQALALRERLAPALEAGASPQERRQLAAELLALRTALNDDFSQLSDKTLKQSSSLLVLEIEQNIDELLQVHCQDLGQAMDQAASYQIGRDGNAFEALQNLQVQQEEMTVLQALQDQTDYPIMTLTQLHELGPRAEQMRQGFVDAQAARQGNPQAALSASGAPTRIGSAQTLAQGRTRLADLNQDRRQLILDSYAQARSAAQAGRAGLTDGMAQAQARWDEQTAAIETQAQSTLSELEQHHGQAHAQLEQACESVRQDMNEASMPHFERAKAALAQGLADERSQLTAGVQELRQDRLGPPRAELAAHLARGQWHEAAPLLAASQARPADLAQLARALDLHAQPDELARFMKALVPADARSRIDFLAQALPRDNEASAPSGPHLATLAALEQIDPGSRVALLGKLSPLVGRHNPGSEALAAGADGQVLRLDDKTKGQKLASARQALVSVASPQVNLQGADLSGSVLHIEYKHDHNRRAWAPSLTGARLDQARIVLDLSDLPRSINPKTGVTELNFDTRSEMLPLFGFTTSMANYAGDLKADYFSQHPGARRLPDEVLKKIEAGQPAQAGLHNLLSSISTGYPQQRKDVACQLLDLALQVPYATFKDEALGTRSPMFKEIGQDPALMADPDIQLRLDGLSETLATRTAARQALAQRAAEPA